MNSDVVDAVANWIRAEYHFRCGSRAYTKSAEERYVDAMELLRKAVTGKRRLSNAYRVLKERRANEQR